MIPSMKPLTMTLERDRVAVQAIIRDMDTAMAGSCLELSTMRDDQIRGMVLRLEAILYGRDIIHKETKSGHVEVKVFEPDLIPQIPASWWDHLKSDLAWWLSQRLSKDGLCGRLLGRLAGWIDGKTTRIPAPHAFTLRKIPTKTHIHKVTAVCPHIGHHTNPSNHSQFLAFRPTDPWASSSFVVSGQPSGDHQRQWREHLFRSHLQALCEQVARYEDHIINPSLTIDTLSGIKQLFDRYGVSL